MYLVETWQPLLGETDKAPAPLLGNFQGPQIRRPHLGPSWRNVMSCLDLAQDRRYFSITTLALNNLATNRLDGETAAASVISADFHGTDARAAAWSAFSGLSAAAAS